MLGLRYNKYKTNLEYSPSLSINDRNEADISIVARFDTQTRTTFSVGLQGRIQDFGKGGGVPGNCYVLKCGVFASMRATFFPSL